MLKKNWKNLFRKTILDRGYGYYLEGAVEDISRENDVISATVSGTELYEVEIFLDHDEVYDMDCDCPYAEEKVLPILLIRQMKLRSEAFLLMS